MAALAKDLPPAATKTGMLATVDLVNAVAEGASEFGFANLVVDPVMVATSGDRLLTDGARRTLVDRLLPLATLVTHNLIEAALLVDRRIETTGDMEQAGEALLDLGARAALIKGGHINGPDVVDVLVTQDGPLHFHHPRLETMSTHGTGCTLSAAIAAGLAEGVALPTAVDNAIDFVHRAIASAPGLGAGHGPLNHFVPALHPNAVLED